MKLTAPHRGSPRKLAIRSKKFPRSALPVSNRMWHLVNAAVLSVIILWSVLMQFVKLLFTEKTKRPKQHT